VVLWGTFLMSSKRSKTVLRTIRLSKEFDDALQVEAEENGITASSLVNRIVKKYVEWDRQVEKFKFASMAAETFRTLIEKVDDETLASVVRTLSGSLPESVTLYWFKKINLNTVLETISLYGKYSGLYVVEINRVEGDHVITLHHELGNKWSYIIGSFISQFIKNELGVAPEATVTDNTTVLTFRAGGQANPQ
jgi:predicted DNA-binding protein